VLPSIAEKGCYSVPFHPSADQFVTGNGDGTISAWDVKTGRILSTFPAHDDHVFSVAISADGKYLVSAAADKTIKAWDFETKRLLHTCGGHAGWDYGVANAVAFHPKRPEYAAGDEIGNVIVREVVSGRKRLEVPGHKSFVSSVGYSRDGARLAAGSWDGGVKVWDVQTGAPAANATWKCPDPVSSVNFDPDGNWLYAACFEQMIWACPLVGGKPRFLKGHTQTVLAAVFSPVGRRIASAAGDATVRLWDSRTHREALTLHAAEVARGLTFSPDGRYLVAVGPRTVRIWEANPLAPLRGQERLNLTRHTREVWRAVFSPDGRHIASGSSDRTVRVWDAITGEEVRVYRGHSHVVFSVAYSSDARIVSVSADERIHDADLRIWDPATGDDQRVITSSGKFYINAVFTRDARHVIAGSSDGVIDIWDASTRELIHQLTDHRGEVGSISISKDGTRMASATNENVIIWDLCTSKMVDTLEGELDRSNESSVALSPDGKSLACGGPGGTVMLLDIATKQRREFSRHAGHVISLAFSPQGEMLATGGTDCTIKLWDVTSGKELRTLRGYTGSIDSLDFNHDGTQLVSASRRDNTVKVWDVAP
jgi:WD40 repeat protein